MKLKDTVNGMLSDDYKERFVAEYQQLDIRINKLLNTIHDYKKSEHLRKSKCDRLLLLKQCELMMSYRDVLETRAKIEGIELMED